MRKSRKKMILKLIAATAAAGLVLWGMGRFYSGRIDELKAGLAQAAVRLDEYEASTRTVVCVATDMRAGDRIKQENLKTVEVAKDAVPADTFNSVRDIIGIARIDLAAGTYLTAGMLAENSPGDDIRELEFEGIHTAGEIQPGSCVDIRIVYSDGTDYVVLAKKNIFGMDPDDDGLILHVSEEELLLMDSATVDAYLFEGARLYATEYVERELQTAAQVNYVPSQQSLELLKNDPNIAVHELLHADEAEREMLEGRMAKNEDY